jgi:hypothetical protein
MLKEEEVMVIVELSEKHIDERLKAPKAKDVDQWLSAPNRFDLPNVDTNKPKNNNA